MNIAIINRDGCTHQCDLLLFVAAECILKHCRGWKYNSKDNKKAIRHRESKKKPNDGVAFTCKTPSRMKSFMKRKSPLAGPWST